VNPFAAAQNYCLAPLEGLFCDESISLKPEYHAVLGFSQLLYLLRAANKRILSFALD